MSLNGFRVHWLGNVRADLLAGMVVALALIPESISFSIIAGVDPKVGLYTSFCIAVIISIVGGRPGMISAATGAMALLMITLVKEHGLQYLLATTVLTGFFQVIAGLLRCGSLLRFVSKAVVVGFVNALAILIFMAQLPEFNNQGWQMYAMVAAGLMIIYLFPYITKKIPSPLVAIVTLTVFAMLTALDIRTVGDMGELPNTFPTFFVPNVPLTWDTFQIIFPYSLTLVAVGLLESLMTAVIVDDLTDTKSNKNRECIGQGIANMTAGFFGGMAGCAMIGQSVINIKSGGRGRLSALSAGIFLLFLVLVLDDWVQKIPMAALVAVMIMVSLSTFNWASMTQFRTQSKSSSLVMMMTVIVVVLTHDLAKGVLVGVLMSAFLFIKKISHLLAVNSELATERNHRTYYVHGQVFFASADKLTCSFNFDEKIEKITIDLVYAHLWDACAVNALDKVVMKFRLKGKTVVLRGLNEASASILKKISVHDKPNSMGLVLKHEP